jgi:ketosteroid isomerase-like protein
MEEFKARLVAAYDAWHASRGRSPEAFYALYADDIELRSILQAARIDEVMRGPFIGKATALAYFTAIAEAWEMVEARVDRFVAEGDTVVVVGHATWRNLKTLRVVDGPKVDVWTVRDGQAARYLEMFDSYGTARALGLVDEPEAQAN